MQTKFLPTYCYPGRSRPIRGLTFHHISAINVEPSNPFDMQVIYNLLCDLNRPKSAREFYPNCAGIARAYASYNYLIGRNPGEAWLLVPFGKEVYHAGKSIHKNESGCNKFMPGIALVGTKESGFTDWQYQEAAETDASLRTAWPYDDTDVVGHDKIRFDAKAAGMRADDGSELEDKFDPSGQANGKGTNFDWLRYYRMVADAARKLKQPDGANKG
jgi:N-acetyl-anhydromuramyl-L-alanine amidase AmpD